MGDVFQEVDEEVRRDQLFRLWRRYGRYLIAAALLVVLGTAAGVAWRHYRNEQMMADGGRFAAAIERDQRGDHEAAARAFAELANDAGGGYSILAGLREAAALSALGDRDGAIAVYDRLAAEAGADDLMGGLARLLGAMQTLDAGRPDDAAQRAAPLAAQDGPWRHLARELQGLAELKSGNEAKAHEIFAGLVGDPSAPVGVRDRAKEILGALADSGR